MFMWITQEKKTMIPNKAKLAPIPAELVEA
jgi:hypothetical protein